MLRTFALSLVLLSSSAISQSAEEDHANMMKTLGIEQLRRGADGNPNSPHAANYDESKANGKLNSLPRALVSDSGKKIKKAKQWRDIRRPEIVEHFEREIYGRVPADLPAVDWQIIDTETTEYEGIPVIRESLLGRVDNSAAPSIEVNIELTLTRRADQQGAAPVIINLTWSKEFIERFRSRMSEEQIRAFNGDSPAWQKQVLDRGWVVAEYVPTSVQADNADGLRQGIIGLVNKGEARGPEDWGALRAWGWGASKAIDYFETRPEYDQQRVTIGGHSRYGKAALVGMAFDQRFAGAYVSSSGEAGAKLWRRQFGEQVGNIAGLGEYHWVAGNLLKYAGPLDVEDMPVDSHLLIALAAPRKIFIGLGSQGDEWTDQKGMFLATKYAAPVFELLGASPFSADKMPPVNTLIQNESLGYRQHPLGHTQAPHWSFFLDLMAPAFEQNDADEAD